MHWVHPHSITAGTRKGTRLAVYVDTAVPRAERLDPMFVWFVFFLRRFARSWVVAFAAAIATTLLQLTVTVRALVGGQEKNRQMYHMHVQVFVADTNNHSSHGLNNLGEGPCSCSVAVLKRE